MAITMIHHGARTAVLHLPLQIHLVLVMYSILSSSAGNRTTAAPRVRCLPADESALLRLKRSFIISSSSIIAFRSWRAGTDCCSWVGVRCSDADGRVTSLHLGDRGLKSGGLDPALFDLTSLEYLNLAFNDFNWSQLPSSGFEHLIKLTHVNLSSCSFDGQVPVGIGRLTNLVSLDLSTHFEVIDLFHEGFTISTKTNYPDPTQLKEKSFETLISKLSNLRELQLGFVDLSESGSRWCEILAKSCPKLEVLSLPNCQLSGSICRSLSSFHSVTVIDLRFNELSGPLPDFLANFPNLSVLQLSYNRFHGSIWSKIFWHKKLVTIDLYGNLEISGSLPNFSTGTSLENLDIGKTNFSGIILTSVSNLVHLKRLGLGASSFMGDLPTSIGNLKSLEVLQISGMGILGSIPLWITNLTSLTTLEIYDCGLSGPIPPSIGNMRNLNILVFSNCSFTGKIPSQISNLTQLEMLVLYSNHFTDIVELTSFRKLSYLVVLDLSHNNLVVLDGKHNSSVPFLPKLITLALAGCNISEFPDFLKHRDEINILDLSDNNLHGIIPKWVWTTWKIVYYFNLANNRLTGIGYSSFLPTYIPIFILLNNMFEGSLPIPQGSAIRLDYSNNRFLSVPYNFSSHLSDVFLFKVSRNNLPGEHLSSFCGGTSIRLLDLSYNNFKGSIPSCLVENVNELQSLDLKGNQFRGEFPDSFKDGCSLEALDLSGNCIEGQLPRSLVACRNLEILDAAKNQIIDTFPCWMSTLHKLEVLVLKSNKFFGQVAQFLAEEKAVCAFPSATIIDISSNNCTGILPQDQWFKNLMSMTVRDPNMPFTMGHEVPKSTTSYKYTTAITYKGYGTTFAKIPAALVVIDFSDNGFQGSIPEAIGELGLLHQLNLSHNSLTGPIPSQLNQLNQLEALDLSTNKLSGEIPQALASMDFLTTLNLSNNELVGRIPNSPHFLTFSNGSVFGNDGLCGPLSKDCINTTTPTPAPLVSHPSNKKSMDIMLFLFTGLGYGVGFSIAVAVT
ncbi:hypothetical protein QOZ80_1AG0010700 [Eleusine coracana subsp. coracana]|nr:hypothetical protein QOZ80_1AG0010700 [Eleusine coracana subsp. coracana]